MLFRYIDQPFPHIIFDKFYTDNELVGVWSEIEYLRETGKLLSPEFTGTAKNLETKESLKSGSGVFLYGMYENNHESSYILSYKKACSRLFIENVKNLNWYFQYLSMSNFDDILVNYYEDGDYYKRHLDKSLFTSICWLYKEPKKFTGGNLKFPDYDYIINISNNTGILLPGCIFHQVENINMDENVPSGYGRYSICQFVNFQV
jgi:Rps23 Pro-64 3,4-dihydroxylase Tpa1-like proline 4-hydroxylase